MMKFPDKMTTEELSECLGVAKQTVNRWIREQKWQTEQLPGVKGGRARLIYMDERVLEYIMKTPVIRHRQSAWSLAEPAINYSAGYTSPALRRIADVLQNMTPAEQERLDKFLAREGLRGFLLRLGMTTPETGSE